MPRNIEIKARIASIEALLPLAQALADDAPQVIEQDDTFFACAHGRLKLRDFGSGYGELIHYRRVEAEGPSLSDYVRVATDDPAALREALTRAHGVIGRVRKTRVLLLVGQTRIHLDRVEHLGDFLELEVVLQEGQPESAAEAIAAELMAQLGVSDSQRLAGAYFDLLASSSRGIASAR